MRRMTWPRSVALAFVFLTAVAGPVSSARADAWTRDQGSWFGSLSVDRWFSDERYNVVGERVPYQETLPGFDDTDEYRNLALRAYGEYGFTREWTGAMSTAFEIIEAEGNGREDRTTGFSDLRLQVKRLLLRRPLVVSAFVELKAPTGYDAETFPALGNGEFDTGAWLAVGKASPTIYVSAEAGYVSRGGDYSDEVPFHAEAGWQFRRDVMLRTDWRAVMPIGDILDPELPFDPRAAHTRSLTGGLSLILNSPYVDLVFGFDQALSGLNALAGTRFTFSVWWDR
jgi:hypothetical protein